MSPPSRPPQQPHLAVADDLYLWVSKRLDESSRSWLDQTIQRFAEVGSETQFFTQFSLAPRKVGKSEFGLTDAELQTAESLRVGWRPQAWSLDQAVRILLLLKFPHDSSDRYVAAIEALFSAADVAEQVALYQSLPLLPYPERFKPRAIEGLRSNITSVFNAIALQNPYPADLFNESEWNQMVLKALFIESALSQIQGIDARSNANLARMLSDYAHERWAAGRSVNPQLWRCLGPFAEDALIADLKRVVTQGELFEQEAAGLACSSAPSPEAQVLLDQVPRIKQKILGGTLTWNSFSQTYP